MWVQNLIPEVRRFSLPNTYKFLAESSVSVTKSLGFTLSNFCALTKMRFSDYLIERFPVVSIYVPLAVKYSYVIREFRVQFLSESSTLAPYSFGFTPPEFGLLYHFDWQDTRPSRNNKPQIFRLMLFLDDFRLQKSAGLRDNSVSTRKSGLLLLMAKETWPLSIQPSK